jgi:hypothetical protein
LDASKASSRRSEGRALLVQGSPQHDRVHDREVAGAAEVVLLDRAVVGEEPTDAPGAGRERLRLLRRDESRDPAVVEQLEQRGVARDELQAHAGRRRVVEPLLVARLVQATGHPAEVGRGDAVVVLEEGADPDGRRHLVLRHADRPTDEVAGLLDAAPRMDVDLAVAKRLRREHGDPDQATVAAAREHHQGRQRHLRDVEGLRILDDGPEELAHVLEGGVVERAAEWNDLADLEGARLVEVRRAAVPEPGRRGLGV